jgi:cyclopropane-fatty-acyl-phospholipid synthase
MASFKSQAEKILSLAGIAVNGKEPWDIQVHDERLYRRVIGQGSLGLGESYMDGWWDCAELDEFFTRILSAHLDKKVRGDIGVLSSMAAAWMLNRQSKRRAFIIGEKHYDAGNDLFEAMLDKRLTYTCGYWKDAKTLDEAQEAKLDLVCRKLGLKKGDTVLDIGCGWGSFAKYAAEKYGAVVTGITVSHEQIALGQKLCEGLPVTLKYQDYRDVEGKFDHVVSLGMFEHVGYKNYREFMKIVERCLKDDGLFLLHTIGGNTPGHTGDPWMDKYIFPNGMLPSIRQIGAAIEKVFIMEDWHNFSADYDLTLGAWRRNVEEHWDELSPKYSRRFHRMWYYYLSSCMGMFRSRNIQLWQIVLSKNGVRGGYRSAR